MGHNKSDQLKIIIGKNIDILIISETRIGSSFLTLNLWLKKFQCLLNFREIGLGVRYGLCSGEYVVIY